METNALWALQHIDHVSNVAICEPLTAIEFYVGGIGAVLFVGRMRLPRGVEPVWRLEMFGSPEQW